MFPKVINSNYLRKFLNINFFEKMFYSSRWNAYSQQNHFCPKNQECNNFFEVYINSSPNYNLTSRHSVNLSLPFAFSGGGKVTLLCRHHKTNHCSCSFRISTKISSRFTAKHSPYRHVLFPPVRNLIHTLDIS